MLKLKVNGLWTQFMDAMKDSEPFNAGGLYGGLHSLRGRVVNTGHESILRGKLPREYWRFLENAEYVVFSYSTPIAWRTPEGWYLPREKYSVSTSKHQGRIQTALGVMCSGEDSPKLFFVEGF